MANLITDWREAVQAHLADYFAGLTPAVDVDVVGGRRPKDGDTAVSKRQKPLLCVFFPGSGYQEISRDTSLAQPSLTIRMFPIRSELPRSSAPADPEPVEEACVHLISAFPRDTQAAGYFVSNLSCRLTGVLPFDAPEDWYAEATLLAYTLRAAA